MFIYSHGELCKKKHDYDADHYSKVYKVVGLGHTRSTTDVAKALLSSLRGNDSKFTLFNRDVKFSSVSDGLKIFLDFLLGSVMSDKDAQKYFAQEAVKFWAMKFNKSEKVLLDAMTLPESKILQHVTERCKKNLFDYKNAHQKLMTNFGVKDLYGAFEIQAENDHGFVHISLKPSSISTQSFDILAYISPSDDSLSCLGEVIENLQGDPNIALLSCLPSE